MSTGKLSPNHLNLGVFMKAIQKMIFVGIASVCFITCVDFESENHQLKKMMRDSCSFYIKFGYTDKVSYNPGEKVLAYMQSAENIPLCRLDIYDLSGNVVFSVYSKMFKQTVKKDASIHGFGFLVNTEFVIPSSLSSGIYQIENQIPFIVKSTKPLDVVVVYPSNTTNAYNNQGGKSLYVTENRPAQVSFLRPLPLQSSSIFCLKWLSLLKDKQVGFIADMDMDYFENISNSKIIIITGHSEYWTKEGRENFDRFIDQGGNGIVLSGNTMWWQVRYNKDRDAMICYKSNEDTIKNELLKTINWDSPSLQYPIRTSLGVDFTHGGYGLAGWMGYKIIKPSSPLLKGLGYSEGDILPLRTGEYDGVAILKLDEKGCPIIDSLNCNVDRIEIIGFDLAKHDKQFGYGTFVALRKSSISGVIVNMSSTDWCSIYGMGGPSKHQLETITRNTIDLLLRNENVFSN